MSAGAVPALLQLLGRGDASAIKCALQALRDLTHVWSFSKTYGLHTVKAVVDSGVVPLLAPLLGHSDKKIVEMTLMLLDSISFVDDRKSSISGEPEAMMRLEARAKRGGGASRAAAAAILARVQPKKGA